jgi:DNA-binding NarL/FixJ family response regulator
MATPISSASSIGASADLQLLQAAAPPAAAAPAAPAANSSNQDTVTVSPAGAQAAEQTYSQVLLLSQEGQTAQQIATALGISTAAVEAYLTPLLASLPTTDTTA